MDPTAGAEPSMEDILASIRKIIADDQDPVALQSPEAFPAELASRSDISTEIDASDLIIDDAVSPIDFVSLDGGNDGLAETQDLEMGDFGESENVLDMIDLDIPPVAEAAEPEAVLETGLDNLLDQNLLMDTAEDAVSGAELATASMALSDDLELSADEDISLDSLLDDNLDSLLDDNLDSLLDEDVLTETDEPSLGEDVSRFDDPNLDADPMLDIESILAEAPPPVEPPVEAASIDDLAPRPVEAEELSVPAGDSGGLPGSDDDADAMNVDALLENLLLEDELDSGAEDAEAAILSDEDELYQDDDLEHIVDLNDPTPAETDPDLDLVKSLISDLTDEDLPEADLGDMDIAIPEPESELTDAELLDAELDDADISADLDDIPMDDADDGDVLDEILALSLDDEIETHEAEFSEEAALDVSADNVVAMEAENLAEADADEALPSLSDIAAAAEQDAALSETHIQNRDGTRSLNLAAALGVGTLGAGTIAATAFNGDDTAETEYVESPTSDDALGEIDLQDADLVIAPEPEAEPTPNPIQTHHNDIPTESETMPPAAAKSDTILDEVTESATANVFAELNQVVEEKAVYSERGPRIGDLVQEALRPMLKEWLDANLKGIVERAVAKEVKRISSGK